MRPQYHFRNSDRGLLAWDVRKLVLIASDIPPVEVSLVKITELDECFWYDLEGATPTCRSIAMHARLMEEADLTYPIILDPSGRVMDGMHRVCKALNLGMDSIRACRLLELPEPDFVGVPPEDLPYDS